nr:glycine zipper 2TM domain-containing protein [Sphingomonas sp. Y57]
MRSFVLAALIASGAALSAGPAIAVNIPAADAEHDDARMMRLPDDWLDKDMAADPEAEKADMREADAERWEDRGRADGEAGAPVAGVDCSKPSGTTGAILGAVAGGLLGNVVDGGRHRALGTIVGAGGGALLGREVEQRSARCR